jgi:hypothetical protein
MPGEQAVVNATVKVLDRRGAVHFNIAAGNGETGLPDRCAIYRGRAIFLEFKAAHGGRVTPKQQWWLDRLRGAGALALVVRYPSDVSLLLNGIDGLTEGRDAA